MTETDGAIYVGVLPDLQGFDSKLREGARKGGLKFAGEFSDAFDAALGPRMKDDVAKATTAATRSAPKIKAGVAVDTAEAQTKLQHFTAQKAEVTARVAASTKQAQVDIDRLTRQQAKLQVKVDADDAEAKAKVDALEERKVAIQAKVDADTAAAIAKIAELDRKIAGANRRIRVDADTSGADSGLAGLLGKLDKGIGSAGGLAGALAAIGPAAVPSLLAAAAGAVALGAAVGGAGAAALGVGLLGFSGLGDAVKALNAQESGAAAAAVKASNATEEMASRHLAAAGAAQGLAQAQRGLKNAQLDAAEATRSASERTADAERALTDAQRQALAVQDDLTQARKDAAAQLEDLALRVRDGALSQQEAILGVARAQERLNQVKADPKATETDKQEAELALQRAQFSVDSQKQQNKELADQQAQATKAGVEGSKQVVAAKDAISQANRRVADAERGVTDALHAQDEVSRHNANSILQAKDAIVSAQRSVQSSAVNMARVAVPAVDKLKDAMANLSPEGQKFARFIFGLKPGLDSLRASAQGGLLPGLEEAIRTLSPLMPSLKTGIHDVAEAMGAAAKSFAQALISPEVRRFLDDLFKTAPGSVRELGVLAGTAARALATIFDQATPAGKKLLADVVTGLDHFLDRISTPAGKKQLAKFFADGVTIVESLGGLLGGLVDLLGALAGAGSGSGPASGIDAITHTLHGLAGVIHDHRGSGAVLVGIAAGFGALKVIGTIAGPLEKLVKVFGWLRGILGLGAAAEGAGAAAGAGVGEGLIAGAISAIGAALGVVTLPVLIVVAALAALGAAFYLAYTRSETFRDIVWKSIHAVGDAFVAVWTHLIHPVITFMKVEIDVLWAVIQVTFGLIQIGLKLLGEGFMYMYDHWLKPWWIDNVRPLLNEFGGWLDEHIVPKMRKAADVIGGIFSGIADWWKSGFSDAIDLVNKLLDVYNGLAHKFGVSPDDVHVNNPFRAAEKPNLALSGGGGGRIPTKAAAGGHITGPGTGTSDDILTWLSNGEFVVRAAAVNRLGVPLLNALNQAGSHSGPGGGHGYAGGGLVDSVLSAANDVAGAVADPAGFLGRQAEDLFKGLPNLGLLNNILTAIPQKLISGMVDLLSGVLGGGGGGNSAITGSPAILALGQQLAAARGWTGAEWSALQQLWQHESGWNPNAKNPTSTAFGIPQFLAGTARAYGLRPGDTNPQHQIAAGLQYIAAAYGDPVTAWSKWQSRSPHWYDDGGWLMPGATVAVNGTGKPEKVLTAEQYAAMSGGRGRGGPAGKPTININYPPFVPPEQALVDAQARADLVTW